MIDLETSRGSMVGAPKTVSEGSTRHLHVDPSDESRGHHDDHGYAVSGGRTGAAAEVPHQIRFSPAFGFRNKVARVLWGATWLLLGRFSPRPLWIWRRFVLRLFGARLGRNVRICGSARIWFPPNLSLGDGVLIGDRVNLYNQGHITIAEEVVVSQDATICASTHDVEDITFPLLLRPVSIGKYAWIAAEAFVGPGVTVGEGAVLGARGVAMRSLSPWTYYTGNPATELKPRRPFAVKTGA